MHIGLSMKLPRYILQKGKFCRCVQSFVFGLKSSRSRCKTPCPGEPEKKCGGPLAFTVFTGKYSFRYYYNSNEMGSNKLETSVPYSATALHESFL